MRLPWSRRPLAPVIATTALLETLETRLELWRAVDRLNRAVDDLRAEMDAQAGAQGQ